MAYEALPDEEANQVAFTQDEKEEVEREILDQID